MDKNFILIISITLIFMFIIVTPFFTYLTINKPAQATSILNEFTKQSYKQMIVPSLFFSTVIYNNKYYQKLQQNKFMGD